MTEDDKNSIVRVTFRKIPVPCLNTPFKYIWKRYYYSNVNVQFRY